MTDFGKIRRAFEPRQDDDRVERMWRAVEGRPSVPLLAGARRYALAVGACVALVVALFLAWPSTPDGFLTLTAGQPVPERMGAENAVTHRFTDGSAVHTGADAALELLNNSPSTLVFALRKGRVRFDIRPGGPRVWQVVCGPVTVEVLGTSFALEQRQGRVKVTVMRGAVLVKGETVDDGVQKITAGQSLEVPVAPEETASQRAASKGEARGDGASDAQATVSPPQTKTSTSKWRQYADHGAYDEAYSALGSDGVVRLAKHSKSADELFALADVARLSGHPGEAVLPLKTIMEAHPEDARVGLAAYTLGKLYLEQLSNPKAAEESLARAEALGLPEALAETANAKRVRALIRAGDPRARQAGKAYLEKYPEGRYRNQVETWLEE